MDHFKRIVVDIDDTISFTTNRDWENATPNIELIYCNEDFWIYKFLELSELEFYIQKSNLLFPTQNSGPDN